MGSFFQKVASVDPIAQAFNLPGSKSYVNSQIQSHMGSTTGPYAGVTPTLAGANAGYLPGGPGAIAGWQAPQPWHQGGFLRCIAGHRILDAFGLRRE